MKRIFIIAAILLGASQAQAQELTQDQLNTAGNIWDYQQAQIRQYQAQQREQDGIQMWKEIDDRHKMQDLEDKNRELQNQLDQQQK